MVAPADHVDIEALAELKEIMEDDFDILIDTFVMDSEAKLSALEDVVASRDSEELRKVAHSLKGSSSNICAVRFSEWARQLESMGKDETLDGAEEIFAKLKQEFIGVVETLKNHI